MRSALILALALAVGCGSDEGETPAPIGGGNEPPPKACQADADCNDGLVCNGLETCSAEGVCASGTPPNCNDNIACTLDTCSNERGGCLNTPPDADGDGRVDANCLDAQNVPFGDDCDDLDSNRFPGNIEICDANDHDEDCNDSTFGFVDNDGDGFASAACCNGANCGDDCDDTKAAVRPGATEVCDQIDNNCNDSVDEGVGVTVWRDADGDGQGDPNMQEIRCADTHGFSNNDGDCDDTDPSKHTGAAELCDGEDNDCDLETDEVAQAVNWYIDGDGDGFGKANAEPGEIITSCNIQVGYSLLNTDCNDDEPAIHPSAAELCDGKDNNCSGAADYVVGVNDFEDDDGDGLADMACGGTDCDDTNAASGPGTVEQCDGQDNDCDQKIDENAVDTVWVRDLDGDGFGALSSGFVVSCQGPQGFSALGGDCDDTNPLLFPGQVESCNDLDDNCNGIPDEGIDKDGDPMNCGACGVECTGDKLTGSCVQGGCQCDPGFGDCNFDNDDGCETNTNTHLGHCGDCFNFCAPANAAGTCVNGGCEISVCLFTWGDCDMDAATGCETKVNTDTQCGDCDNDCTNKPNAVNGFCDQDRCEVGGCSDGFADCNNDGDDGCESNLVDDPENCGNCYNRCENQQNTTGTCGSGTCECIPDYLDCFNPNDGCESHVNDPGTCGGCENNCYNLVQGGDATCDLGACGVNCHPDRANCSMAQGGDGDPLTCETFLGGDDNCSACGDKCLATNGDSHCEHNGTFQCVTNCHFGYADCDADSTTCETDIESNDDNCGDCGIRCGAAGSCDGQQCDGVYKVVMGEDFTCALRYSGGVACWGANDRGQLGDGTTTARHTPVQVPGLPPVHDIAAGQAHVCIVTDNRSLFCWGDNSSGQIGDGAVGGFHSSPHQVVPFLVEFGDQRIAAGSAHTCAHSQSGFVYCWGANDDGESGVAPAGGNITTPTIVMWPGFPSSLHAGDRYTCANDGSLWCWGTNDRGQRGDGNVSNLPDPGATGPSGFNVQPSTGFAHVCYRRVTAGAVLECWGADDDLQVGNDNTAADEPSPVLITGAPNPENVSAHLGHTCYRDSSQSILCWGSNNSGQMGQDTTSGPVFPPVAPQLGGMAVERLGQGAFASHSCIVDINQDVWCWGANASGQVGVDPVGEPTPVAPVKVLTREE